jgi:hypothetical protein
MNTKDELAFFEACKSGRILDIEFLLKEKNVDINCSSDYNDTGLMYACINGQFDTVRYLLTDKTLKHHSKIELSNNNQDTALSLSCYYNRMDIVRYLLTSSELTTHANIHQNDDKAIRNVADGPGDLELFTYLLTSSELKAHSDPYAENEYKNNALNVCLNCNKYDFIAYLLYEYGLHLSEKDKQQLKIEDIDDILYEHKVKYEITQLKEKIENSLEIKNTQDKKVKI